MAFWDRIPRAAHGWITLAGILVGLLGAAFAAGAATSGRVEELKSLPPRVTALEAHEAFQDSVIARLPMVDTLSASNRSIVAAFGDSLSKISAAVTDTRCYVKAMALDQDPIRECSKLLKGGSGP